MQWSGNGTSSPALELLTVVLDTAEVEKARGAAQRGAVLVPARELCRDLANRPATILTAVRIADVARDVAAQSALEVEVFDRDAMVQLGCGGLRGLKRGSPSSVELHGRDG